MSILRKIVLFFLVLEIAVPTEVPHVFTVVPAFLEHYAHHNEEHHPIGLVEFMAEHFISPQEHHADKQHPEHDQCPMSHNHAMAGFLVFLPEDPKVDFHFNLSVLTGEKIGIQQESAVNRYSGTIWQPPRLV